MDERLTIDRAAALEAEFMSRVARSVARPGAIPGSGRRRPRPEDDRPADFGDEVRRMLLAEGILAGEAAERLPRGARAVWALRRWPLARRPSLLIAAGVRHPFRALALSLPPAPLPAAEALAALPAEPRAPLLSAVLSTSGWEGPPPDVPEGTRLWLVEPARGGGYRTAGGAAAPLPACLAPETDAELLARAAAGVTSRRAELVLRGLAADRFAGESGIPLPLVERAFREAAARDEFLLLAREEGTLVLRRA